MPYCHLPFYHRVNDIKFIVLQISKYNDLGRLVLFHLQNGMLSLRNSNVVGWTSDSLMVRTLIKDLSIDEMVGA